MFKKTLLSAVVLGLASTANAAMYVAPKCEAGNVTVPCEGNAWDLGIDLLYLRNQETTESGQQDVNTFAGFQADHGYGFRLEGSYHFGTGNDFVVNWSHFSKKTETDIEGNGVDVESLDSKFDIVNFELGQHIDAGEMWDIRIHGGLQYASVKNDFNQDITDATDFINYKLRGFGPRTGLDVAYNFGSGFAVFANAAVSILNAKGTIDAGAGAGGFDDQSRHMTTTATDKRIGVMYTHAMAQGDLTIRGGYQTQNFINGGSRNGDTIGQTDLGFDGWFIGLKWVGNA